MLTRGLVYYTHFFSSKNCNHGSGGTAVDFDPSQEDLCVSACQDFKFIAAWFLRYSFSSNVCHHGSVGAAVDPCI
jgi:hypothetical protein